MPRINNIFIQDDAWIEYVLYTESYDVLKPVLKTPKRNSIIKHHYWKHFSSDKIFKKIYLFLISEGSKITYHVSTIVTVAIFTITFQNRIFLKTLLDYKVDID